MPTTSTVSQEVFVADPGQPTCSPIELDAKIGRFFGVNPSISWEVVGPDGKSTCFSSSWEGGAEKWLSEHIRQFPNSPFANRHVEPWEHFPRYSESDADALGLIPLLRSRGYEGYFTFGPHGYDFAIGNKKPPFRPGSYHQHTIAKAIFVAVLSLIDYCEFGPDQIKDGKYARLLQ